MGGRKGRQGCSGKRRSIHHNGVSPFVGAFPSTPSGTILDWSSKSSNHVSVLYVAVHCTVASDGSVHWTTTSIALQPCVSTHQ